MSYSNLPPGVTPGMLPGNRPEDEWFEEVCNLLPEEVAKELEAGGDMESYIEQFSHFEDEPEFVAGYILSKYVEEVNPYEYKPRSAFAIRLWSEVGMMFVGDEIRFSLKEVPDSQFRLATIQGRPYSPFDRNRTKRRRRSNKISAMLQRFPGRYTTRLDGNEMRIKKIER